MLLASQHLVVAGAVDARSNLYRAVVRPSLALPIALVISFVYFNLGNPFDVLDAEDPGHHGTQGIAVCLGEAGAVHHVGEQDIAPHRPLEGDTVIIAVRGAEDDVPGRILVGAHLLQQGLQ